MENWNWMAWYQAGGPVLLTLLGCSVIGLALAMERGWFYLRHRVDYPALFQKLQTPEAMKAAFPENGEKGAGIFRAVLKGKTASRRAAALELALESEKLRREKYLPLLATLAVVAPFLGLLGTIGGIMKTFREMGASGLSGPQAVAAGVGEALVSTAAGLLVAILAVTFFNLYKSYNLRYLAKAANLARRLALELEEGERS